MELEARVESAEQLLREHRSEDALHLLLEANSLVRGVPFDEFATEEFAVAEVARSSEVAWHAIELAASCAVRSGNSKGIISILEGLVTEHPLRESAWSRLIDLLASSGRMGDAVLAGKRATEALIRELGVAPGSELARSLENIGPHAMKSISLGGLTPSTPTSGASEYPTSKDSMLHRDRLVRRMLKRFSRRLTILEAGAGFGKSVLLDQAIGHNSRSPLGDDRIIQCRAAESTPADLGISLCELFGMPVPSHLETIPTLVASRLWAIAPRHVAIIVDDAHNFWGNASYQLLERLLIELPANGHLVLSSRTMCPEALVEVAGTGQIERLTEADLSFTDAERIEFCTARGVASDGFPWIWPAMAELALRGRALASDFLCQEVLNPANLGAQRAVSAVLILEGADEELATALLGSVAHLESELASLPLVTRDSRGSWRAHSLWANQIDADPTDPCWHDGLETASALLALRGELGRAVNLLHRGQRYLEMLHMMAGACRGFEPTVSYLELSGWVELIPVELRESPLALLVQAFADSRGDQHQAQDSMVAAAAALASSDDVEAELNALIQVGRLGIRSGYLPNAERLFSRIRELAQQGHAAARELLALVRGVDAFERGDERGAWLAFSEVASTDSFGELANYAAHLASTSAMLLGRVEESRQLADQSVARATSSTRSIANQARGFAAFAEGDIESAQRLNLEVYRLSIESDLGFNTRATLGWSAALHAFAGQYDRARASLERIEGEVDAWQSLAIALVAVGDRDERTASAILRDVGLRRTMLDRRIVSLAPAVSYILLPMTRAFWEQRGVDLDGVLGDRHQLSIEAARALLRVRNGERIGEVGGALGVPMLRSVVPLPWGMELAVSLAREGNIEFARTVVMLFRAEGLQWLGDHQSEDDGPTGPIRSLLHVLPARPTGRVALELMGRGFLRCQRALDLEATLSSGTTFELVAYLALNGPTTRPVLADAVWPHHPRSEVLLGEALSRLRMVTEDRSYEPSLLKNEPGDGGWLVKADGDHLYLTADSELTVDTHVFHRSLEEANSLLKSSSPARALESLLGLLRTADENLLQGLMAGEWAVPHRRRWRELIAGTSAQAAVLLVADGSAPDALDMCRRSLAIDPYCQLAWAAEIDARLQLGDFPAAMGAADRCRSVLKGAGVTLGAFMTEAIARGHAPV